MGLFKPIWESKNPDKIQRFIEYSHDMNPEEQKKLSGIALHCSFPELRYAAAKKLKDPALRVTTIMEAKKNGDIKTVQAFIDSINYSIFNDGIFIAAVKNGDLELLSMLAMKIKTLSDWNLNKKELEPLLNSPGFDDAVSHYNELKRIDNEAKREIARQKREEANKKKHDAFLRNPVEQLREEAGKQSERKLWQEWYEYELLKSPNRILLMLKRELSDLNWSAFFPKGAVRKTVLDRNFDYDTTDYLNGDYYNVEKALKDLEFFLRTLYDQRDDLREEVLSLNDTLFYKGRRAGGKNLIDDWTISWDSLPPYKLSVFLIGNDLQIHLDEQPKNEKNT